MLIRELKRDSGIDTEGNNFKDHCELVDRVADICLREARNEPKPQSVMSEYKDFNNRKGTNKKVKYSTRIDLPKDNKDTRGDTRDTRDGRDKDKEKLELKEDNDYFLARTYESKLTLLSDKISKLELELHDKNIDLDDYKTRIDVVVINNKQDKELMKNKLSLAKAEIKELKEKIEHLEKEAAKLRTD